MAADRVITCTNKDGDFVEFRETGFFPFLLMSVDGIYDNKNDVFIMENALTDGGVYEGSRTPYRNIVLTVKDKCVPKSFYSDVDYYITDAKIHGKTLEILNAISPQDEEEDTINEDDIYITSAAIKGKSIEIYSALVGSNSTDGKDFVDHRQLLDKVFKKNESARLMIDESGEKRVIDYYVESITSTGTHSTRIHTISLICPDPFFYNPTDEVQRLGELLPAFEFIHEFTSAGEQFGFFNSTSSAIQNETANDNIGLTISISGEADILNPGITRLESGEYIRLGTNDNPFTLSAGDTLIITTGTGNKHVYLISNGITTEVNYLLVDGSTFVQLMRGTNNLFLNCDSGRQMAHVEIGYRMQYARA